MRSKKYEGGGRMATVVAQKWGNSLGIRVPKDIADQLGIKQGTEVELSVIEHEGIITLKPKKTRKKYTLEELISQITAENRHEEVEFGVEGRELI
ncbi:AbrB/MazE/SpoVT family DNA-binding domain-containing protein [Anoxybacillus sp. J5B_2022]|uniref:AbrB/MazE/SpoVT family DNA-binding domain-containing protein n=1 Tax=Anoxybacillus sp. J5B_2022 TaxID=3003246 RepID=UPI003FA41C24